MADIFAVFTKEVDDILKPNKLIKIDTNLSKNNKYFTDLAFNFKD